MNTAQEKLATKSIPSLVLSFAATTFAALIFNSVYTLTDALFVSWGVGDNAMGSVSVVFPFIILQSAIATAVGGGAASIISRMLGKGDAENAGNTAFNAMLVFYISAVIITIVGFVFMNPLLKAMGVTDELFPLAKQYFIIILAGNVFSTGFSSIIRAEGKMLYALLIWVIPISLNIIFDAIFILVLKWGISGSAAATVICQFTSFLMCVIFFTEFSSLKFKGIKPSFKRIGEILSIGLPSLVQMGSLSIMSVIINNVLSSVGGTMGVNTFAYISKIITFGIVPFTAIAQSLSPIVGYNFGAGKTLRVKSTIRFCIFVCFVYSLLALIVFRLFPSLFIRIFTNSGELISSGVNGLKIVTISLPFAFIPMIIGASKQATGNTASAFIIYSANLTFLIPSAFILSRFFGMNGAWWSYVLSSILATLFTMILYFSQSKKSERLVVSSVETDA